jgi:hypothetical protein
MAKQNMIVASHCRQLTVCASSPRLVRRDGAWVAPGCVPRAFVSSQLRKVFFEEDFHQACHQACGGSG